MIKRFARLSSGEIFCRQQRLILPTTFSGKHLSFFVIVLAPEDDLELAIQREKWADDFSLWVSAFDKPFQNTPGSLPHFARNDVHLSIWLILGLLQIFLINLAKFFYFAKKSKKFRNCEFFFSKLRYCEFFSKLRKKNAKEESWVSLLIISRYLIQKTNLPNLPFKIPVMAWTRERLFDKKSVTFELVNASNLRYKSSWKAAFFIGISFAKLSC